MTAHTCVRVCVFVCERVRRPECVCVCDQLRRQRSFWNVLETFPAVAVFLVRNESWKSAIKPVNAETGGQDNYRLSSRRFSVSGVLIS